MESLDEEMPNRSHRFQILSLNGGGIKGVFTAKVLEELEQKYCKDDNSVLDHFDMICGTSIGGIIALGLAFGQTPSQLLEHLKSRGAEIFPPRSFLHNFVRRFYAPLYDPAPLRALLEAIFGDATIADLKVPLIIPAINTTTGSPKAFKTSFLPTFTIDQRFKLVDVALATSAAPTYFPLHKINGARYADGGLIANSPALMGVHEAMNCLRVDAKNIHVLSIGTMSSGFSIDQNLSANGGYLINFTKIKSFKIFNSVYSGLWGGGKNLISLTMSANEAMHNFMCKQIIADRFIEIEAKPNEQQVRNIDLDKASIEALEILESNGTHAASNMMVELDKQKIFNHFGNRTIMDHREG
ncbi:MAG: patatin-like phospholipase family protein [Methyloprofundus sp.]|nr:patatin-like phospholipase family protein [Methyloprofundus sp.]